MSTTTGIVLAAGPDGREKIFRAYYSSCCGGMTNPAHSLAEDGSDVAPLKGGTVCLDCQASPRFAWVPVTVSKSVVHRALARAYPAAAQMSAVKTIRVVSEFQGRPVWIDVVGPADEKVRIRAQDLRLCLLRDGHPSARGLYSANCRILDAGESFIFDQGRGFGHGVGLCQWGAEGKAEKGYSVRQILESYYPGAKLFRTY